MIASPATRFTHVASKDGVTIVVFSGDLDSYGVRQVKQQFLDYAGDAACQTLVVHMEDVTFAGSAAVGMLMSAARRLYRNGGRLCVVGVQSRVASIFQVTGLFDIVKAFPTREAALGGSVV